MPASCSGFAEVFIYSGFVKEPRPGSKRRATRAVLVVETGIFAHKTQTCPKLALVFSLDTRRTDAVRKAKQSFDDIVNPKPFAPVR